MAAKRSLRVLVWHLLDHWPNGLAVRAFSLGSAHIAIAEVPFGSQFSGSSCRCQGWWARLTTRQAVVRATIIERGKLLSDHPAAACGAATRFDTKNAFVPLLRS